MTVAQWHKAKMELLMLILLTKVCARGVWHTVAQLCTRRARPFLVFLKTFLPKNLTYSIRFLMPRHPKKSKYKSVVIKKKRYYFYKITWLDITGDSGHADLHTASGFMPSEMITHAYLLKQR